MMWGMRRIEHVSACTHNTGHTGSDFAHWQRSEITATAVLLLHLLRHCRRTPLHCIWSSSAPHLDLWAVWTSTKPSSTRATDNMAMHEADSSSLWAVACVAGWCRGLNNLGNKYMRRLGLLLRGVSLRVYYSKFGESGGRDNICGRVTREKKEDKSHLRF